MTKLAIVIPCLNEASTIGAVIDTLPNKLANIDYIEVLVVDDGSSDSTTEIAKQKGTNIVRHNTNKGLGIAFRSAVSWCLENHIDIMVTIDGDGQFNVADIPSLIQPIVENLSDFVTATRFKCPDHFPDGIPPIKLWGNRKMAKLIGKITKFEITDAACGFRAYSRDCLLNLNLYGKFTYTQETFLDLIHKGFLPTEVPTKVKYFAGRKSRMASNVIKYGVSTSKIIFKVYRDHYPLKILLAVGLTSLAIGGCLGIYFIGYFLEHSRFYGALWAGLSAAFLIGLALFLLVMGLVLDILGRIRSNQERILLNIKKSLYE